MRDTYILAIETSCDDTGIAIIHNHCVLANIVISTMNDHKKYGGIVPEIAARGHEKKLSICLNKALIKAKIKINQITYIAYTNEPGLPGSIHVGKVFAKSLSFLLHIPLLPINHIYGHIYSFALGLSQPISYPFLSLVVSGGHTSIFLVKDVNEIKILNDTVDDAIGETLDKVGRMLNLPYPGGISIDKIYSLKKSILPIIKHNLPNSKFSFSGVKTYILNYINQMKMKNKKIDKIKIGSSLLKWVVDETLIKLKYYLKQYPQIKFISIGGGVSANRLLRSEIIKLPIKTMIPKIEYTNDNAAMIGYYALLAIKNF